MKIYPLLCLFICCLNPLWAKSISIPQAFQLVKKNRVELRNYDFEVDKLNSQRKKIRSNEDLLLMNRTHFGIDKLRSTSLLRDYSEIYGNEFTLSSQNSWGSRYSFSMSTNRSFIKNPMFLYQFSPAMSSGSSQIFVNPNYTSQLSFSWEQPLWRNWGGRESVLREDLIDSRRSAPKAQKKMLMINYFHKVEGLFYQLSYLDKLKLNTSLLREEIRSLRNLTRKRMKIGRSDSLSLADMNTQLVEAGGYLLDVKLNQEKIQSTLQHFIFPSDNIKQLSFHLPSLKNKAPKLPVTLIAAKQNAWDKREDLIQIKNSISSYRKELALVKEQNKASIDLFLGVNSNAIKDSLSKAVEDNMQLKNNYYSIGISIQKNLTSTANQNDRENILLSIASLENDVNAKENEVHEKLSLLYQDLDFLSQKLKQADKEISSLRKMIKTEDQKYKQARSDKVTKVKYHIKILEIQAKKIEFHYSKRLAEINIKLLCHSYE